MVLCLLAALVYSDPLVVQKPLVSRLSALHVTWLACTVGALACLPFAGQLVDDTSRRVGVRHLVGDLPRALPHGDRLHDVRLRAAAHDASSLGITTYLVPPLTIADGLGVPGRGAARRWRTSVGRSPWSASPSRGASRELREEIPQEAAVAHRRAEAGMLRV